jgi:ketosteroid isomerase-like protein
MAQAEHESEQMISTIEHNDTQAESLFEATGLGFLSPDVELDLSELLDGRVLRGREAVQTYFDALQTEVWQEFTMHVEEIADASDSLVALVRWQGVGRGSGVPVDMRAAWIATMRDGLVASARLTLDRESALEAVGA